MTRFPRHHRAADGDDVAQRFNALSRDLQEYLAQRDRAVDARLADLEAARNAYLDRQGTGDILWAWNERDVAQFGATSLTTPTSGSSSLSVTTVGGRPTLALVNSGMQGRQYFPVLDFALPVRYQLHYRVTYTALASQHATGWLLHTNADAANLYGMEVMQNNTTSLSMRHCEAGTFTATGGTGGMTLVGGVTVWPGSSLVVDAWSDAIPFTGTPNFGFEASAVNTGGGAYDGNVDTTLGSWAGVYPRTVALGAFASALASSATFYFQDIYITRHPLDG